MVDSKTVVVIPAYNAANVLPKTLAELPRQAVDEIIVVDDGSSDNTAEVAYGLGLKVVAHSQNKGYGAAQKSGYKAAIEFGAAIIVMVHGDNQYDPSLVPQFIDKIKVGGFDVVTGTRMLSGDALKKGMPLYKFVANRFLTALENFVFRTKLSDYHNGFRAYSADFLKRVPLDLLSDKFDFDTDIIIQAAIRGCRIAEVPNPTRYKEENSQMPFFKGVVYGLSILATIAKYLLHKAGFKNRLFVQRYNS